MADRSKSSRLFSRLSKRRHSSKPLSSPSQALTSPFPDIQITPVSGDRDESDGSLLHLPTTTTQTGGDSQTFFRHTLSGLFRRSSSSGSSRVDQSPLSGPPNKSLPLSPHLGATNNIPRDTPIERVTHDNTAGHLQLGRTGVDLDISSLMERIPSSSAVPTGDRKKTTIAATRLVLQTAASALRFVPIANLDQIPNILLTWLQVYESVDDNDENLKGLGDEVRKAHETIFRPLQLWTGQVPHEISDVIQQFNSALQGLLERIEALKRQKLAKRVIRATEITQEVSSVKSCIGDAISRFTTAATTLNLLHTIRLSVDYELLKLHKVDAQYSSVISRSECLESTRVEIQRSILDRLKEREHRFVWLRGSPGTGKTAISTSVASTLDKRNHLAASFFWDKNQKGTGLDSIKYFPSTLARQLASFNAEYEGLLVSHLRQPLSLKIVPDSVLEKQMKAWIIDPMHELKSILSSGDGRFGIVLDGLDECGTQEELECLMKLVLILDELPAAFAVLVSCRPESSVTSAWGRARSRGLVIPCEDVDALAKGEKFHTVRRIVEEGLRNRIEESLWKPSGEDLDAFAFACRELPVIASTRVRDVCLQTRRGATLESEFKYFRDLTNAPVDVNSEYLRVLRRAYVVDSSGVRPQTAKKYFQVVGTIIAAHEPLSVFSMSQLLGMSEEEVLAILEPISSLVDLSQVSRSERSSGNPPVDAKSVIFYHATMKEFITGDPIGNENDRVFFFKDVKGYFLGLPLLRFLNNSTPDVFGMPTTPPLGDEQKWKDFREFHRPYHHPQHLQYAIKYLFRHLDPSQLFAQDNDLQNEFNTFLVRNLVTFMLLAQFDFVLPAEFRPFNNCDSFKLLREAQEKIEELCIIPIRHRNSALPYYEPSNLYRSLLPFTPSSSPFYKLYGYLSDPVQIFTISGKFSGHTIPLSEDSLNARMVMETKLPNLPRKVDRWGAEEINYEAQFNDPDVRNGIVTCAALSPDGDCVALGFGSGIIELAGIDHQRTISRFQLDPPNHPIWIEFVHGSHRVVSEDNEGNVAILSHGRTPVNLGTLPNGPFPAATLASDNGLFIVRVPRKIEKHWYDNMTLISVSDDPHVQLLASPDPSTPSFHPSSWLAVPHRRTLGFSPVARYIGAFDGVSAFTWSTESGEFIACYRVTNFSSWIMNPTVPTTRSYLIPDPVSTRLTPLAEGDTADVHLSGADAAHDSDGHWIKHPFLDLSPSMHEGLDVYSSVTGRTPLLWTGNISEELPIWFDGRTEFTVPRQYPPVDFRASGINHLGAWYGDRVPSDATNLYRLRSSKDGTRFLLQGQTAVPIVVDISQVV